MYHRKVLVRQLYKTGLEAQNGVGECILLWKSANSQAPASSARRLAHMTWWTGDY